ncbi:UDP-glucose flavonoid 3-O-glucosyltransferase 7-like [Vigna unguiculata]|uniref:UDP-glucose flavonoid 3-O-glucosyltransferase 7-like n=1 Tax=Vigna unguiculata TaxID=3917 RepID=UPI0010169FDE|nr:UDP-glucose flavonoid 3-O-glucosyltransferase 7-like [Vigna unguiculata]
MTAVIFSFWLQVHNRDIYDRAASSSFPFKPPQLQSATARPHQISLVQLSRLVASRGQHVTIVTTPGNAELFQKTIDDDIAFDHHICVHLIKFPNTRVGLPEAVENMVSATMSTTVAKIHMAAHFIQPQIEVVLKESHPNVFIPDILFTWSKDLSKTLQIQRLVFNPISIFDVCMIQAIKPPPPEAFLFDSAPYQIPNLPHPLTLPVKPSLGFAALGFRSAHRVSSQR